MSELQIPEASYRAMLDAQDDWDDDEILANSIRAVAAPIVAAELRRIADQISIGRETYVRYGESDIRRAAAEEGLKVAKALCGRADKLDGGAR